VLYLAGRDWCNLVNKVDMAKNEGKKMLKSLLQIIENVIKEVRGAKIKVNDILLVKFCIGNRMGPSKIKD
jgi:hypothetical protein